MSALSPIVSLAAHTVIDDAVTEEDILQRTAKIFMSNRSQEVRLPKGFQSATSEVFIRKQGDDVILSPRPKDWSSYLTSGLVASEEFMGEAEDLPAGPNQPVK
jgi:antitoxin VapB